MSGFEIAEDQEVYFVNEYETDRCFGGPEEGGWWFDTGRFIRCRGIYTERGDAVLLMECIESEEMPGRRQGSAPAQLGGCPRDGGPSFMSNPIPAGTTRQSARGTNETLDLRTAGHCGQCWRWATRRRGSGGSGIGTIARGLLPRWWRS